MGKLQNANAYLQYLAESRDDLELPDWKENSRGYVVVLAGERYCRAKGCTVTTLFSSTNNLKKHITSEHFQEFTLFVKDPPGGRPTAAENAEALEFYEQVIAAFTARKEAEAKKMTKPKVPKKSDGSIHLTNMRRMLKEKGYIIPCDECKSTGKASKCCREEVRATCDHWDFFDHDLPVETSSSSAATTSPSPAPSTPTSTTTSTSARGTSSFQLGTSSAAPPPSTPAPSTTSLPGSGSSGNSSSPAESTTSTVPTVILTPNTAAGSG